MFSDHLKKIDNTTSKVLLLIAGGLLIVGQLVAMVLVAQGQVEKAHAREASQTSQRIATAWCVETSRGAELRGCATQSAVPSAQAADRTPAMSTSRY